MSVVLAGTASLTGGLVANAATTPVVYAVDPNTGTTAGGTQVAIIGNGFSGVTGVNFGPNPARRFFPGGDARIFALSPPGPAGPVDVTVFVGSASSAHIAADTFTYVAPTAPSVNAVDPRQGTAMGGTSVTIFGSGFSGATGVSFGSSSIPCLAQPFAPSMQQVPPRLRSLAPAGGGPGGPLGCFVNDDGTLSATTPPGSVTGTAVDVKVTTPSGTSAANGGAKFTYTAATRPVVNAVGPHHGSAGGGTFITIFGSGLSGAQAVQFGLNNTVNPCPTGIGSPAVRDQQIRMADKTALVGTGSTRLMRPFAPTGGGGGGGGPPPCFFQGNNDNQINLNTPAGSPGTVDITVTTAAGTSLVTPADKFTFDMPMRPVVSALDPSRGTNLGGANVSIFGSGFSGATMVHFGSSSIAPCGPFSGPGNCFNVGDDSSIFTSTPPQGGDPATVDVSVTTPIGTSLAGAGDKYTWVAPTAPVIYAIDPPHGSASGGINVQLLGAGFEGATSLTFGSVAEQPCPSPGPAPCFIVGNDQNLFTQAPSAPLSGATMVTLTTPAGSASIGFTYDPASLLTVSGVSPNTGPQTGCNTVFLSGTGFRGAQTVTFGGQQAGFFVPFGSDTVIQATVPRSTATVYPATVDVAVTTSAGTATLPGGYTYTAAMSATPTVTAVSPGTGMQNTTVDISGTGFCGATGVSFGTSVVMTWFFMNDNVIQAIVPSPGTQTGTVHVIVSAGSLSSTPTAADQFTYGSAPPPSGPVLDAVSPNRGSAAGGAFLQIIGRNLANATGVSFGSTNLGPCMGPGACFSTTPNGSLFVQTPPQGTNPAMVHVHVTAQAGTSTDSNADQYTFVAPGAPTVNALSPSRGSTNGGTSVQIYGNNLAGATAVTFGSGPPQPPCPPPMPGPCFGSGGDNFIFANAPPGPAGPAHVTVTTPVATSQMTPADLFTYVPPQRPSVSRVYPTSGPSAGGTMVYISGANLSNPTGVNFGAMPAFGFFNPFLSDSLILASSPFQGPNPPTVDVTVTTAGGTSPINPPADQFSFTPTLPPTVTGVSPNTGLSVGGTTVFISGTNLFGGPVNFGSSTSFNSFPRSPNLIQAMSPPQGPNDPNTVDVRVNTPGGTSPPNPPADQFTYTPSPKPAVTAVSPNTGPQEGATQVFISGNDLGGAMQVNFGSTTTFFFTPAPDVLAAFTPSVAASTTLVDVTVTTRAGASPVTQPADQFTFTPTPAPTIAAVSPSSGPAATGVYISGTDLNNVTAVQFGSVTANLVFPSPDLVFANSPPGTLTGMPVDVTVTTATGSATAPAAYTYTAPAGPPVVTAVGPSTGPPGTVVFISGSGLGGATAVTFGGAPAAGFFIRSDNVIRATAPVGMGTVPVQVTVGTVQSALSSADQYTYGPPPVAVLPAMANAAYGGYTTVTYVQNTGTAPAHVSIRYVDTTGQPVGRGDDNSGLPVNAVWTVRQDNGHSFAPGGAGSGVIFSDQPVAAFVNEFAPGSGNDATSYTAIQVPGGLGPTLFAPAIASLAYGGYTTGIGLVNASLGPATITITYRKADGSVQKVQTLTGVPAGAYRGIYSGNSGQPTDANLPAGFAGTATIQSSAGLLAAVVNETGPGGQFSSYDAGAKGATTLYAPVTLNDAYGGFNTGIGLQNVGTGLANVTISYAGQVGNGTTTRTFSEHFTLAAGGYNGDYNGGGAANPVLPDQFHGSASISSDQPLAVIVNEVAAPATAGGPTTESTSYNTFAAGAMAAHLPLVENAGSDGLTTSIGIENVGSSTASVTIDYYDAGSGSLLLAKTVSIAAGSFLGEYTPNDLTMAGTRATAVVTAASPVLAVIGNEVGAGTFMSYDGQ